MQFHPKFTGYRFRIAVLALVLWINVFAVLGGHRISSTGIVILAVATTLAAVIPGPEFPGKVKAEKYPLT